MTSKKTSIPNGLLPWIEARRRFRLSHAHVQMARELGLNPKKFGKIDNHDQERWKMPLPDFITHLYRKRFGRERPDPVRTIEEIAAAQQAIKKAKKARKALTAPAPSSDDATLRAVTQNAPAENAPAEDQASEDRIGP